MRIQCDLCDLFDFCDFCDLCDFKESHEWLKCFKPWVQ